MMARVRLLSANPALKMKFDAIALELPLAQAMPFASVVFRFFASARS